MGFYMFQFKEVCKHLDMSYSFGPYGYAYYKHPKRNTWEVSASISNELLQKMINEKNKGDLNA
jgi:hypothetical protein